MQRNTIEITLRGTSTSHIPRFSRTPGENLGIDQVVKPGDDSIAIPRFSAGVLENLGMDEVLVPPSTSLYMPKPKSDGRSYYSFKASVMRYCLSSI